MSTIWFRQLSSSLRDTSKTIAWLRVPGRWCNRMRGMKHASNTLPRLRVVAMAGIFALALTMAIHAQVPAPEQRLWTLDLGSVPSYRQLKSEGKEAAQAASVVFVDANTVAVTYRVQHPTPGGATDAVSFFDAASGALRNTLKWPTTERFSADRNFIRVLPTHYGEFLVIVGYSIRRYSSALKQLQSREILSGNKKEGEWVITVSPDGKMALLKGFGPGPHQDHWFSTETLEDRSIVSAPFYGYGYAVGQGFVVYNSKFSDDAETRLLHIHSSTGEDRVLCADCKGGTIGIVNDRIFFGGVPVGTGVLVSADGKTVLRQSFSREHQLISQVSVARESTQIAFYMTYLRSLRAISRVVVLDTATLREVRRIDFEDPGEKAGGGVRWLWPGMAISPDGMKLAMLWRTASPDRNDVIELFPLTRR